MGTKLTRLWNDGLPTLPRFSYTVPRSARCLIVATLLRLEVPRTTDMPIAAMDESIFFDSDGNDLPIPVDDDSISEMT
ncbi:MAG: hypothetical protein QM754_14040 [Tepidisphaeraceae bacterium]